MQNSTQNITRGTSAGIERSVRRVLHPCPTGAVLRLKEGKREKFARWLEKRIVRFINWRVLLRMKRELAQANRVFLTTHERRIPNVRLQKNRTF